MVSRERPELAEVAAAVARDTAESVRLVYIQFPEPFPRTLADELRDHLNAAGFNAPGVERIERSFQNSIRYFHPGDAELAARLARQVERTLIDLGCTMRFEVGSLSRASFEVPPRPARGLGRAGLSRLIRVRLDPTRIAKLDVPGSIPRPPPAFPPISPRPPLSPGSGASSGKPAPALPDPASPPVRMPGPESGR